ncbi:MAG: MoxR family ATPase [Defluviitaleaceae bacterium]|nr:MoxR family ATPase [Defluviitaleaceae bacterium]
MRKNPNVLMNDIINNVEQVIVGKRTTIELALCAFLCGGHVLIEDIPGVGKTSLVYAIAKSFDCSFKRIQFTPDILPSDITGFSMYNQKTQEFEYQQGSIMAQIILADEINRTSPKTQSSLLEVMEENQVTVDGKTYKVPQPFTVFATQNPVEHIGTYPLPEAQMDRFFMRLSLGYPTMEEEISLLNRFNEASPIRTLAPVSNTAELMAIKALVPQVHVDVTINELIVHLIRLTRIDTHVMLGCSPRGTLNLQKAAQAWALYQNRTYVTPDDVLKMAVPVLAHRLVLSQEAKFKKLTAVEALNQMIANVKIPR